MDNLLIIDKENSKYLVRPTLIKWVFEAGYSKPKKSKKGYVGSKYVKEDKKDFLPDYEANAIEMFQKYKEKYEKQLKNKEIVKCIVSCFPVIKYITTCPICGKNAEICTFMCYIGSKGAELDIYCTHCANSEDLIKQLQNKVGVCYDDSFFFDNKSLEFKEEIRVHNIKWEDWEKGE